MPKRNNEQPHKSAKTRFDRNGFFCIKRLTVGGGVYDTILSGKNRGGKRTGLIAAKCTNCGAAIEVDDSKEAGICKFCGTAFITEKVIQNYNYNIDNRTTVNNNIETAYIQNGDSFEELFVKYQSMIKIQNIDMAMKIVDQMYNKFPHVGMVYVVAAHLYREKGKYGIDLAGGNISPRIS